MLDVLHTFDQDFSVDLAILAYIVIVIVSVQAVVENTTDYRPSTLLRMLAHKLVNTSWKTFGLMVGQEEYMPSTNASRVAWLFLVFGIFAIVFGYLLNFVSSELAVSIPTPLPESLADLFETRFEKFRVVMLKNAFYYDDLKTARPGTKLKNLFNRMNETSTCIDGNESAETCNFIPFHVYAGSKRSQDQLKYFYERVMDKTVSEGILSTRQILYSALPVVCGEHWDLIEKIHMSREAIATGVAVPFANRLLPQYAREFMDYRAMGMLEFALYRHLRIEIGWFWYKSIGGEPTPKGTLCIAEAKEFARTKNDETDKSRIRVKLSHLRKTYQYAFGYMLAWSSIVWLLEFLVKNSATIGAIIANVVLLCAYIAMRVMRMILRKLRSMVRKFKRSWKILKRKCRAHFNP